MPRLCVILLVFVVMVVHGIASGGEEVSGEALLHELQRCLKDLPAATKNPVHSECTGRDVSSLGTVSRDTLLAKLGQPTWGLAADTHSYLDLRDCFRSNEWGYSFYRLPPQSLGGGPELVFQFSADGTTTAKWLHTQ